MTQEEFEALHKDALRYRWLRDDSRDSAHDSPVVVMMDWGGKVLGDDIDAHGIRSGMHLDQAIDAAMSAEIESIDRAGAKGDSNG